MQGPKTLNMPRSAMRGASQLFSSGSHVAKTVEHRRHNVQRSIECTATTTSGVKLPATHLQASQAALQQLQQSTSKGVNREFLVLQ